MSDVGNAAMLLLGPLSSASPNGQGLVFSWFSIVVGGWVLLGSWISYLRRRKEIKTPLLNLLWISGIGGLFIVLGVRDLLR